MKKIFDLMAYAAIVFMGVFLSLSLASCGADESYSSDRITPPPAPADTTHTDPTPDPDQDPEPTDTITFIWNSCMAQSVDFKTSTEEVISTNKWQVTENGQPDFVDAVLRYTYGVDFSAPTRVTTVSQDTTAYRGGGLFKSDYSNFRRVDKDSLWDVSSYIEGGYKTTYYTMGLKTHRMEGIDLRAGKRNPYLNVKEHPTLSSIWHEKIKEVEVNDSVFNRETVHNVLTIALISDKGQTWRVKREKIVVVDHFVKIKEGEKEEDKINWDYDVEGLGRMVSLTINIRPDTNTPYVCAHFEGSKGHTFIVDNYDKDGKYTGHTEKHFLSYDIAEKSNDYNGVGFIKGNFYPGYIEYTIDKKDKKCGWVITCRAKGIEDGVPQQSVDGGYANTCGLKNFHESNSAYTTPFIKNNTSTSKEVNGKKVWYVSGKTSENRELVHHTVIDSSLK